MSEGNGYLKFLINEPIYLVKEAESQTPDGINEEETVDRKVEKSISTKVPEASSETSSNVAEHQPESNQPKVTPEVLAPKVPTKKLLVIYQFEESEALPVHLKKLMLKIIEAVGIDVMQGVYVNQNFKAIPEELTDFENILIFSSTAELPLEGYQMMAPYETQVFGNTRVLVSDELPQLDQQVPLKRKLWGVLQEMFPST